MLTAGRRQEANCGVKISMPNHLPHFFHMSFCKVMKLSPSTPLGYLLLVSTSAFLAAWCSTISAVHVQVVFFIQKSSLLQLKMTLMKVARIDKTVKLQAVKLTLKDTRVLCRAEANCQSNNNMSLEQFFSYLSNHGVTLCPVWRYLLVCFSHIVRFLTLICRF